MTTRVIQCTITAIAAVAVAFGQAQTQTPPATPAPSTQPESSSPVAKQPKPKSQKEVEAIMALQTAMQSQNPDQMIQAAENLITKFADTEFKEMALLMEAAAYEQKNDREKMIITAERVLEVNPNNYGAMLMIARADAQGTREHDFDKEEKLGRAEKYARRALEAIKTAPRPRPDITDDVWNNAKKDYTAQAHEVLGLIAQVRKQPDKAISEFKTAIQTASNPDPRTMLFLARLYVEGGKHDEALAEINKALAQPELHPQVKQIAEAERDRVTKLKGGAAKPAATPPAGTPPATPPAANTPAPPKP
jgi:tetratricopeptide (TPR) repeat protein